MSDFNGQEHRKAGRGRRKEDNSWHLNKTITVGLIVALVGQAFTFGWWGSTITSRIDQNAKAVVTLESVPSRLLVIETIVRRLELKVDQQPMNRNYGP